MKPLLTGAVLALTLGASAAWAQTPVSYTQEGRAVFTVDAPDFWSVRTGGGQVIEGPDGEGSRPVPRVMAMQPTTEDGVWMGFLSPPDVASLAEGRAYLREVSNFLAFEPEIGPVKTQQIGGRSAEVFSGTGKRNGKSIGFSVAVISLPGGRVAIAAAVMESGTDPDFVNTINEVYASFRAGG